MRITISIIATLLLISFSYANDQFSKTIKNGIGSVSGILDTSSVPYRIFINHNQSNEEVIFIKKLSTVKAIKFNQSPVTVTGKVSLFRKTQYIISVETIEYSLRANNLTSPIL